MNVICDLDGVIWLAEDPIPGSPEAVARLRAAGHRVLYLTNNSNPTVGDLAEKLASMGIPADPDDIATSSQAAALLVDAGQTALVCGGTGVAEALEGRGARVIREGEADAVVVGFHREFDYKRLTAAFRAVAAGARLIGTNDDPTYPTPNGPVPGGGALLAAVATASGVKATVAGKPNQAMADLVAARLGDDLAGTVLVGDRPSTDGLMAARLGVPFILVQTGVKEEADLDMSIELEAADLASVVDDDGNVTGFAS